MLSQCGMVGAQEGYRGRNPSSHTRQLHSWGSTMGFFSTSLDFSSAPSFSFIPFHNSFICQNSLCQALSRVQEVQIGTDTNVVSTLCKKAHNENRQVQYSALSAMTGGGKEEYGNTGKDHLVQTSIVRERFPEEGALELRQCTKQPRQR